MANGSDRIQDLTSRIGALHLTLDETLARLKVLYGPNARAEIESLRDELVKRFKQSGIPADRELEHAKVVRPAVEVLETIFNSALTDL